MLSHVSNIRTEWSLKKEIFYQIFSEYPDIELDLFSTRFNAKLEKFVSWGFDPLAYAVDAFSLNWSDFIAYAFPPFSLINRILDKVILDKAEMVLITPHWPTQSWFATLQLLTVRPPLHLPICKDIVMSSLDRTVHPLCDRLHLIVWRIIGNI